MAATASKTAARVMAIRNAPTLIIVETLYVHGSCFAKAEM
jgi:hypothetical protein